MMQPKYQHFIADFIKTLLLKFGKKTTYYDFETQLKTEILENILLDDRNNFLKVILMEENFEFIFKSVLCFRGIQNFLVNTKSGSFDHDLSRGIRT